jgi:hypothetical protein
MSLNGLLGNELARRALPEGGFVDRPQGRFRVDATAWGILASRVLGSSQEVVETHCSRLVREQGEDGRVRVSPHHPECYWPTALALLAWQGSPASQSAHSLSIRFLLNTTGIHFAKKSESPSAHDTALKGWPWIEDTHSWVEPTATCVMALRMSGYGRHDRVREAVRMLLDRQLPHGGWNAGNTIVFGHELHPMPEGTGSALASLAGAVDEAEVARSLDYLHGEVDRLRTPISLGWSLIGLAAWGRWPSRGVVLVERCLANQGRYGGYDTSSLCLLTLGALAGDAKAYRPLLQRVSSSTVSVVSSS